MISHLAARAANCNVGTWKQRWDCGWNSHGTAAYKAGFFFGHNIVPVLIVVGFLLLAVRATRRRKAPAAAPARRPGLLSRR